MIKSTGIALLTLMGAITLNPAHAAEDDTTALYRIELHNLTPTQWFSPYLCALHDQGLRLFRSGQAASTGQATFAEDGFHGVMADELRQHADVHAVLQTAAGLTPPGASRVEFMEGPVGARLTCAAMPVTTNDVLTVVQRVRPPRRLDTPREYESIEWNLGSEVNNYSADAMPEDSVNLLPEGPDNPVTISENVVFGPDGRPDGVPSLLSPFTRAFIDATGTVIAEGTMSVFSQFVGSETFPADVYGWTGSASRISVTRVQ